MTIEEKRRAIRNKCLTYGWLTCDGCPLHEMRAAGACHDDATPEEIEENYNILFGSDDNKPVKPIIDGSGIIYTRDADGQGWTGSPVPDHNGCCGCKYFDLEEHEEPCAHCKHTVPPYTEKYKTRVEYWTPENAPEENDVVKHPAHYCYSDYEPKDVIRAWGLNFNLGSTVKYIARAGRKDDILQDLNKAKQFLEFEIAAIENERGGKHE